MKKGKGGTIRPPGTNLSTHPSDSPVISTNTYNGYRRSVKDSTQRGRDTFAAL